MNYYNINYSIKAIQSERPLGIIIKKSLNKHIEYKKIHM